MAGGATAATGISGPAPARDALRKESRRELDAAVDHFSDAEAQDAPAAAPDPAAKLDVALHGLAEKVEKEGKDGSLTAGAVTVTDFKIDVMIYLADASDQTREALKKLGFESGAESRTVRLVVGSIDVRKLMDLVKLDAVLAVKPVGA